MLVQELAHHWATKYDWRKHEAYLNNFPQFKLLVNGIDLHFVHLRSSDPDAVPLLLSHGWPGSFYGALVGLAVCSGAAAAAFYSTTEAHMHAELVCRQEKSLMCCTWESCSVQISSLFFAHANHHTAVNSCLYTCKFIACMHKLAMRFPHCPHFALHAR